MNILKKSLIFSVPCWIILLIIIIAFMTPQLRPTYNETIIRVIYAFVFPGIVLWLLITNNINDINWYFVCFVYIIDCILYYFLIVMILYIINRLKRIRKKKTELNKL